LKSYIEEASKPLAEPACTPFLKMDCMVEPPSPSQPSQDDSVPGEATPPTDSEVQIEEELSIPWPVILRGLNGVAVATKAVDGEVERIAQAITTATSVQRSPTLNLDQRALNDSDVALSLRNWHAHITATTLEENLRHRANIALAMAFLCQSGRQNISIHAVDLDFVWSLVREALTSTSITFTVSRSAQGFLAVPLWSLMKDGNIDELFRLHVWLPDGKRGISDLAIHAHQPFAQSWILAGEGRDHTFEVQSADASTATHAEFGVGWSDSSGKESGKAYQTHQKSSTVVNTGKLVRVAPRTSELHSRNMTYTVPAGICHRSEVAPDILHATLFFFDSYRGFQQNAPVIGPVDGKPYTQERDPAGVTPAVLAKIVESVRAWETLYGQGLRHAQKAEWEEALRAHRSALHICQSTPDVPNAPHYRHAVMGELGHTYRMLGRYDLARATLEDALHEMPLNQQRVESTGELAVVYRHMNRLEDAKRACDDEYNTAKHLNLERDMCRAVGNLGMVNYQLFLSTQDMALLDLAISQLTERVERARRLKEFAGTQLSDPNSKAELTEYASQREAIALARLSLCFAKKEDIDQAISVALEALNVTFTQKDTTKIAFSRFFYGRALRLGGQDKEALAQFNPPNTCTPAIALCKEPSDEHREYIREMIKAGADLELRDEQGYSALDCAVYSGDTATQKVIEEGLRLKFAREAEEKLEQHLYEATLRKGYRELFQDKLRPVLLGAGGGPILEQLRHVYADSLAKEIEKSSIFDGLKFVRYTDFLRCKKLPRSSDGFTDQITLGPDGNSAAEFIIFFSYRWIAKDPGSQATGDSPDDIHNSQYQRMIRAVDEFLKLHPKVDREKLCIWIVSQVLRPFCMLYL
jgi:tetratricopeptide (TPR) repeat protein